MQLLHFIMSAYLCALALGAMNSSSSLRGSFTSGSNSTGLAQQSAATDETHVSMTNATLTSAFDTECFPTIAGLPADPPMTCYKKYTFRNCYSGHGGVVMAPNDPAELVSQQACGTLCSGNSRCAGFVYMVMQQKCWLRLYMDMSQCEHGVRGEESSEFDSFVKYPGCLDLPGAISRRPWYDGYNGCAQYAINEGWCTTYGATDYNGEGTANSKCCTCGGGSAGADS